jgi:hypothetical protein
LQAANNQPTVKMVAPDYHEEDGDYHSNSSSTQLPSQHPLQDSYRERHSGGVDFYNVLPTPLSNRHHLLSPVRTETPSHSYNLRTTPDRIAALDREGSQGDDFGRAVAEGGVAGSAVVVGSVAVSGEAELQEEVSLVALGAMEDVVGQERLQQLLLVVTLGSQLLEAQLEEVLVLGLEELALEEQWREVVVEVPAEHDNPLVLQQEALLGEELKTTPLQKLTPSYRPLRPLAQLATNTGRL